MRKLIKLAGLLLLPLWLAACSPNEPKLDLKGTDVAGASIGGDFTLTDHQGQRRSLSQYQGKVVALFFGYTHCPDVCPTTMLEYAAAVKQLGDKAGQVQVLFVSIDPERDTPQVLAGYVPHFNRGFVGLTGTAGEVEQIKNQYKIVAQRVSQPGGGYSVDHSAGSYLLDKQGRLRVFEAYGTPSASLAHDIDQLLR
ncbi:SCO family protein [Chromobacterium haemolyticum]|uniref:SCO family protein n=1 Tax=Chromobacterium fluminis TaxID=3044269 RepID=A0ABX0L1X5_9NEIS|nr:SCO family protein [Chromobacterium haemolyticum]NHR03672.1 SCO family protein [Chromobacterium haemolyticum]OQS43370.1 SCO family protein [Chromobacterium haemolyticum]